MSILIDKDTRLCVSGVTGREGAFHTLRNRDYGTQVVSGVTPGKGGQDVDGIPVFEADAETDLIVMCGEIAGFTAPPGETTGHASAIVSGSKDTAAAKGVRVGRNPTQVAEIAEELLAGASSPNSGDERSPSGGPTPGARV